MNMKIRVTSVAAAEVGEKITDVTNAMEDLVGPHMAKSDYGAGVEQVSIFYISIGSDLATNLPFCQAHNKAGRYKDPFSGRMVKYVGIAVPLDFEVVQKASPEALNALCWSSLFQTMEALPYSWPKDFDHARLLRDLRTLHLSR